MSDYCPYCGAHFLEQGEAPVGESTYALYKLLQKISKAGASIEDIRELVKLTNAT